MALRVQVKLDSYPEGKELGFNGLGVVENGGTLEVDEEQEASFYATNGMIVADAFKDQEGVTVSGSASFTPPKKDEEPSTPAPEPEKPQAPQPSNEGGEG